jgi:hypothetical protein
VKATTEKQELAPLPKGWRPSRARLPEPVRQIPAVEELVADYDRTLDQAAAAIDEYRDYTEESLAAARSRDADALVQAAVSGKAGDPGRKAEMSWHRSRLQAHTAATEALAALDEIRTAIVRTLESDAGQELLDQTETSLTEAEADATATLRDAIDAIHKVEGLRRVRSLAVGTRESGRLTASRETPAAAVTVTSPYKPPPVTAVEALQVALAKLEKDPADE